MASLWLASRDPVMERVAAGEPVADAELLGLLASRELALDWVDDRETYDQLATAFAELAFRAGAAGVSGRAALGQAIEATRAGLARAPADPKDWMQLGYLLMLRDGDPSRAAAEAFLYSIRTGALQAPDFLRRRLFWSLAHWAFYDEAERRQVAEHIRLAWRVAPGGVADLALYGPEFHGLIAAALEEVPAAQRQFLAALAFATPIAAGD